MYLKDLLSKRLDLSTFIVHLTRDTKDSASENLKSIISSWKIEARSIMGHAKKALEEKSKTLKSQKCVSFTETPLEYLYLFFEKIDDIPRECQFSQYGIAMTKKEARYCGINPVWYVDMTPGNLEHEWLTNSLNGLLNQFLKDGNFSNPHIEKLMPFFEHMGTWSNSMKEFWWEREWRHVGNLKLPENILGICPEEQIKEFENFTRKNTGKCIKFIDPTWGQEQIIAHLANFKRNDFIYP